MFPFAGIDPWLGGWEVGTYMTIKKRASILSVLPALAIIIYCSAGYYSPYLIHHVVEQSLIQKAPPGIDATAVRRRLDTLVSAEPDKKARVQRLLRISEYLEKIQRLSFEEWNMPDKSFLIK